MDCSGQTATSLVEWSRSLFHSSKWQVCGVFLVEKFSKLVRIVLAMFWNGNLSSSFPYILPKAICSGFSCWKPLFLFFMICMNFQDIWLTLRFCQIHTKWCVSCFFLVWSRFWSEFSLFFFCVWFLVLCVFLFWFFLLFFWNCNFWKLKNYNHAGLKVLSGILEVLRFKPQSSLKTSLITGLSWN